jgi:hypothetical protein
MSLLKLSAFNIPSNIVTSCVKSVKPEGLCVLIKPTLFKETKKPNYSIGFIETPQIYFNGNNKFSVELFNGSKPFKIFPPYGNADFKKNNKLSCSIGRCECDEDYFVSQCDESILKLMQFEKYMCALFDFVTLADILFIDITSFKSDAEFLKAVYTKLNCNKETIEAVDSYVDYLRSNKITVESDDSEIENLFALLKPSLMSYFNSHKAEMSKYASIKFFGKITNLSDTKLTTIPKTKEFTTDDGLVKMNFINSKLNFNVNLEGDKPNFYVTKYIDGKALKPLTTKVLTDIIEQSRSKLLSFRVICNLEYQLIKVSNTPHHMLKWNITQIKWTKNNNVSNEVNWLVGDDDDSLEDGWERCEDIPCGIGSEDFEQDY